MASTPATAKTVLMAASIRRIGRTCSITGDSRDLYDATRYWIQLTSRIGVEPVGGNDDGRGATHVPGARRG
jgi:hypothetical protein